MRPHYAALDIGCSSLVLASGTKGDAGLLFSGVREDKSRGFEKGTLRDRDLLTEALRVFFRETGRDRISPLFLCLPAQYVLWEKKEASVPVHRAVSWREIRILQAGIRDAVKNGREQLLHCVPIQYKVNGDEVVEDPLGKRTAQVTLQALVAKADCELLELYLDVVQEAGGEVEAVIAQPLAEGECISAEEKESGVLLGHIGCTTSFLSSYTKGLFSQSVHINFGGQHIDADLAYGLKISRAEAEKLKPFIQLDHSSGWALPSTVSALRGVSPQFAREIVEARVEEIFQLLKREAERAGIPTGGGNLVLTGGSANLKGIDSVAERVFSLPVRIARGSLPLRGSDVVRSPGHASAVGALFYAFENYDYALSFWSKCATIKQALFERIMHFF